MMRIPYHGHQKIDQYEITAYLGKSQGCLLYLAQDWSTCRYVLLKVLDDTVIGGQAVFERFQQECAIGTRLHHPALQRYIHHGETRQEAYLVLDYLPGATLRTVLLKAETANVPIAEVLRIMTAVCEALEYLHTNGVIHRDIKPEHIILMSTGEVKLTGLGLAEWLSASQRKWGNVLSPVGTPDYLAPELFWGHAGSVQSDIYAVGIVLYELLCGRLPFLPASSLPFISRQLSHDPPDILLYCPTVPPALATVVMRAIRRDPDNRYASMHALLDDLRHLDQVPPRAYKSARAKFGGQYRGLLVIALLVLLLLLALIAFGLIAQQVALMHHA